MDVSKKMVAIVVPMSNRVALTADEKISYRHLIHYLGGYDKYLVAPRSLEINYPGFGIKKFGNQYFGSAAAHSTLLLSPQFYEAFTNYRYILIYHLDALVFSDQLAYWCEKGFDFIGPPWIRHKKSPNTGFPLLDGKVGNGGFSLRNVESFLRVAYSSTPSKSYSELIDIYFRSKNGFSKWVNLPKIILKQLGIRNNARFEMSSYPKVEEVFWANRAAHYYSDFKIPSVEIALRFGFEYLPKYCYEKNDFKLPFGCHAWNRYDRKFWEPFLLEED